MSKIEVYATHTCGYCRLALRLLDRKGVEYSVSWVDEQPHLRAEMASRANRTSVPQIFIDGKSVGGFDDLSELEVDGRLDELLEDND